MARSGGETPIMDPQAAVLVSASAGFDHLFSNRLAEARSQFATDTTPFHLLGLGVCAFMEAALGMEVRYLSHFATNETLLDSSRLA